MTIQADTLPYSVDGLDFVGYLAEPSNPVSPSPGVLVLPEWWGLNSYVRRRTEEIAQLGYIALGVDLYGNGKTGTTPEEAGALMNALLSNMDTGTNRLQAALATLAGQSGVDPGRLAAIGFCFGGAMALHLARIGTPLKAAVSFHGALDSFHDAAPGTIGARVLICHGEADELVSQESVLAFHEEMKSAETSYQFISYPGALHGFTSPEADENGRKYGLPLAYNENADKQSWQAMRELLADVFSPVEPTQ